MDVRSMGWSALVIAGVGGGLGLAGCSDDTDDAPGPVSGLDAATDAADADAADADDADDAANDGTSDAAEAGDASDAGKCGAADAGDADADAGPTDAGTAADCLAESETAAWFSLPAGTTKCVVGSYVIPKRTGSLSWGRHGGPLAFEDAPSPTIVRWTPPAGATGTMTRVEQTLTVPGLPAKDFFWSGSATDLPFFGWTAVSWTGAGFAGELILADAAGALTRFHMKGLYGNAGLSIAGGDGGRLLYTGLSTLSTTPLPDGRDAGLWAADTCGCTADPMLEAAGSACGAPEKIATWRNGDSGLVARDPAGNVFAILAKVDFTSSAASFYEARGFERSTVAKGAGATSGTEVFTLNGKYVTALAADGHRVYYQPNDGDTYTALDVESLEYAVDATAKTVSPVGAATKFLTFTSPTNAELFGDDAGRLWVAVPAGGSDGGAATEMRVFVIREKTP